MHVDDIVKLLDPTIDSDGKITADPEITTWPELPITSKNNNTQIMLKVIPNLQGVVVDYKEVYVTVITTVTASTESE